MVTKLSFTGVLATHYSGMSFYLEIRARAVEQPLAFLADSIFLSIGFFAAFSDGYGYSRPKWFPKIQYRRGNCSRTEAGFVTATGVGQKEA
jgi:hypothetical protein